MAKSKINRTRGKAVTIRMTDAEYSILLERVEESGLSQQAFIINAIKGAVISPSDEIAVLKDLNKSFSDLNTQFRGLATNVNQMAHIANGHGYLPTLTELEKLMFMLSDYRKEHEKIWQSIRLSINQPSHMEP